MFKDSMQDAVLGIRKIGLSKNWDLFDFNEVKEGEGRTFRAMFYNESNKKFYVVIYDRVWDKIISKKRAKDYYAAKEIYTKTCS